MAVSFVSGSSRKLEALDLNGRVQTKDRFRPALSHLDLACEPKFRFHDLPCDLLSEIVSYVPHAAPVSTSFKKADFTVYKESLYTEILQLPMMKKAVKKTIQYLYLRQWCPKGPPEDTEKQIILKTKREVASLIQKGMSILPKEEQVELLEIRESRLWSLQRLENVAQKIAKQRRENLIQFFETLIENQWIEPESLESARNLKNEIAQLLLEERAQRIRAWFREERPFLNPLLLENLELGEAFLGSCSFATREIFFLRGMREFSALFTWQILEEEEEEEIIPTELDIPLIISALHNQIEILEEVLKDSNFVNVSRRLIRNAFSVAAGKEHLPILRALLASSRGSEISANELNLILCLASRMGRLGVVKFLLSCERASEISKLGNALRRACIMGHLEIVKFLVQHNRAHEIVADELEKALGSTGEGHFELEDRLKIIELLLTCEQASKIATYNLIRTLRELHERGYVFGTEHFLNGNQLGEVSTGKLRWVFLEACFGNQVAVVQKILNSTRAAEISSEDLDEGLEEAELRGCLKIIECLLKDRVDELSLLDISLLSAVRAGDLPSVQKFLNSARATEISIEMICVYLGMAIERGHPTIVEFLLDSNVFKTQDFWTIWGILRICFSILPNAQTEIREILHSRLIQVREVLIRIEEAKAEASLARRHRFLNFLASVGLMVVAAGSLYYSMQNLFRESNSDDS